MGKVIQFKSKKDKEREEAQEYFDAMDDWFSNLIWTIAEIEWELYVWARRKALRIVKRKDHVD